MREADSSAATWSTIALWLGLMTYTDNAGWWNSFAGFIAGFFGTIVVAPIITFVVVLPVLAFLRSLFDATSTPYSKGPQYRIVRWPSDGTRPPKYTAWLHVPNGGWTEIGSGPTELPERAVSECLYLRDHAGHATINPEPVDAATIGLTSRYDTH